MGNTYIEDQEFKYLDFSVNKMTADEYDNCTFINCIFAKTNLSNISFADCVFDNCDLSMSKLTNTTLRDVRFKACKMLGLHFEDSNPFLFSVNFESCQLSLSSFYKCALKNMSFNECHLNEVDFTESDLNSSVFNECDLTGAIFENAVLEKVDFRTSYNFSIDPENNRIAKAKFSQAGIAGLLDKYDIEIE